MLKTIILLLSITSIGCNSTDATKKFPEILKIKIEDRTLVDYYVYKKSVRDTIVTDSMQIKALESELDLMQKVPEGDIQRSFGFYRMILYFKNGERKIYGIVYTVYDGVIIYQEGTENYYKNNALDRLLSRFFPK